jgi:hypothetical protein
MPSIEYEIVKNISCDDTDFKIGDIVSGTTYMYRNQTFWYKIIKMTPKQIELEELPVSYPTEYMSNTPGDECVPVLKFGSEYYVNPRFPYWVKDRRPEIIKARPYKVRRYEIHHLKNGKTKKVIPKNSKWEFRMRIMGNRWLPSLSHWDEKPGWVNCD